MSNDKNTEDALLVDVDARDDQRFLCCQDEERHPKPVFKVGDDVYCPTLTGGRIVTLCKPERSNGEVRPIGMWAGDSEIRHYILLENGQLFYDDTAPLLFHVTPNSHKLLSELYPYIKFEYKVK